MRMEILWNRRRRMPGQIVQSSHREHPEIIMETQDRHVAFDSATDANACIESVADNVAVRRVSVRRLSFREGQFIADAFSG